MREDKPLNIPIPKNTDELTKTCFKLADEILRGNLTPSKGKSIVPFYATGLKSIIAQYNAQKESGIKPDMSWFTKGKRNG
jgi:hypothetical protein